MAASPSSSLLPIRPSETRPASTRAGSILPVTTNAGPSRLAGHARGTTTIANHSQIATIEDAERVLDELLEAGPGELSLTKLEEMMGELLDRISNAFDISADGRKTQALYGEVIDRIQLLISTLTTTGLGAIPLNTPSTATLPELAKRIEKCTGIAYERRVELRDSSRGIVEVLAGGGHIRRGA